VTKLEVPGSKFVDLGGPVHYVEWDGPAERTFVLVHGLGGSYLSWVLVGPRLAERGRALVSGYSRGMRQRLGIARALVNDPQVVFLDEPTLGLDPIGQRQVLELVVRIARQHGVTVVLSTHLLAEVEQACDRVLILNHGRVVAFGTVAEVASRAAMPQRILVNVPPELRDRTLGLLAACGAHASTGGGGDNGGDVELSAPAGVAAATAAARALGCLLEAGVPVLGFTLEGGRLSDAFLAVTEDV